MQQERVIVKGERAEGKEFEITGQGFALTRRGTEDKKIVKRPCRIRPLRHRITAEQPAYREVGRCL